MKNGKLRRLGGLLALLLVLTCLLSMSAFAGANERYGYTQLNENQQELYEKIHEAVAAKDTKEIVDGYLGGSLVIDDLELYSEDVYETLRMFVADYPEYYWFDGTVGIAPLPSGMILCLTGFQYSHTDDDDAAQFEAAAAALLEDCPNGSDYEKALYIHDVLVDHIVYDLGWQSEQSAYSALVNGRAVCAGYARSYQYLLNCVGIDAWTVEGYAGEIENGQPELEPHAWNLVWIDGTCVYTDVTWDDQKTYLFHSYFNRCLNEIDNDHTTSIPDGYVYVEDAEEYTHCISEEEYAEGGYTPILYEDYFTDKLPSCKASHEELTYYAQEDIVEIEELFNDTYEILADAVVKVEEDYCLLTFVYEDYNKQTFGNWLSLKKLADALPRSLGNRVESGGHIGLNGEVQIKLVLGEPDPYKGLHGHDGYIDTVKRGELTAYVSYEGTGLDASKTYETVMVAYYSEDHALQSVDFTQLKLDTDCCGELESDCPDEFAYCRIFVVGSDENPEPLCDLLELSMPK